MTKLPAIACGLLIGLIFCTMNYRPINEGEEQARQSAEMQRCTHQYATYRADEIHVRMADYVRSIAQNHLSDEEKDEADHALEQSIDLFYRQVFPLLNDVSAASNDVHLACHIITWRGKLLEYQRQFTLLRCAWEDPTRERAPIWQAFILNQQMLASLRREEATLRELLHVHAP